MHTRWLAIASTLWLAILGLALSFLPHEVLVFVGESPSEPLVLLAQLAGAMAVAWALLNWFSRGQRMGGIYSRPLTLANFLHFTMGSLTLLRMITAGSLDSFGYAVAAPYAVLAIWWGLTLFTSPV